THIRSSIESRRSPRPQDERTILMIDFYALTSPNVQKIFIMLEETGLPYNIKPVDVWAGEQFSPEFAKINPLLKVPAIVDNDGPGGKPYTVIESGAILIYLRRRPANSSRTNLLRATTPCSGSCSRLPMSAR